MTTMTPEKKFVPASTRDGYTSCSGCGRQIPQSVIASARAVARAYVGPCSGCKSYVTLPSLSKDGEGQSLGAALFGPAVFSKVAQRTTIVRFALHAPTWDRKIRKAHQRAAVEIVAKDAGDETPDQDAVRLSTEIADDVAIKKLSRAQKAFAHSLDRISIACPILGDGCRMIPVSRLSEAFAAEATLLAQTEEFLDELATRYDEMRERAKDRLGPLYRDKFFPPFQEIKLAYQPEPIRVIAADVMLGGGQVDKRVELIDKVRYDRMQSDVARMREDALRQLQDGLRTSFATLCATLRERIKTSLGQQGRRFDSSNLENVKAFLSDFSKPVEQGGLNVMDDAILKGLVEKAKGILDGVEADDLKEAPALAESVAKTMDDVNTVLASLKIVPKPVRKLGIRSKEADEE